MARMKTLGKRFVCLNLLPEGRTKIKFPKLTMWVDVRDGKISFCNKEQPVDLRKQYNFVCGDLKDEATEAGVSVKKFKETMKQAIVEAM